MLEYQSTKNIFAKGYVPNLPEEVFLIKKVLEILKAKKMLKRFTKRNCKKKNKKQKEFRVEKVITGKGDKLYVKLISYDNIF